MDKYTFRVTRPEERSENENRTEPFGHFKPTLPQRLIITFVYGTIFGRGYMRKWLSLLVVRLGSPLDVTREACNFRLYLNNNLIDFGLLLRKGYNGKEITFLKTGLSQGGVAVDIGSNIGLYTVQLAKTGAKVVAIDPNPLIISRLRFNVAANDMDNVHIFECAVGDKSSKADLHIRNDDLAIVATVENEDGNVIVQTLKDILDQAGATQIDALKIDVEGYEDKALAPFILTCSDQMLPKRIVIEEPAEDANPQCQAAFRKRGYKFVDRTPNNALYELQQG